MWALARTWARRPTLEAAAGGPARRLQRAFSADAGWPSRYLPSQAEVVIMGGGVIGSSVAYHLTKLGVRDVVLLERNKITSGTTWHSAGLVWNLRPNDLDMEVIKHSYHLFAGQGGLTDETGLHSGYVQNGGLFIATTKERMQEYKRMATYGKQFNIEAHLLTPEETQKLYPLMYTGDLVGSMYVPQDGTVSPADLCAAYNKGARMGGARIFEDCPVQEIRTTTDTFDNTKVTSIVTPLGEIKCDKVINCGGSWARKLGQMAGVEIPLMTLRHAYVVTEPIEGIRGMPNVRDHDLSTYFKLEGDGLSLGGYERNPVMWRPIDDFAFGLFDLDWEHFEQHIMNHMHRLPVIGQTGIKSTVCGPESFTADHKPLMGLVPSTSNYYVGAGFNSAGMMLSGGAGLQLAAWVATGYPLTDMFGWDIRRFHPDCAKRDAWIDSRSTEAYAKNYAIAWPHDEPQESRAMRTSPLYEHLRSQGAVHGEMHGFERPNFYLPPGSNVDAAIEQDYTWDWPQYFDIWAKEHLTCREKVAIFDQSSFGKYVMEGADTVDVMEWICSNHVGRPVGSTIYTQMCDDLGRTQCDLTVSRTDENSYYVVSGGAVVTHDFDWILRATEKYAQAHGGRRPDVRLTNVSDQYAVLGLMGPNARKVLEASLSQEDDVSNEGFPFGTNRTIYIAGVAVRALRITYVGELGWELHVPAEGARQVYDALWGNGQPHGMVNAGYRAINSLSMEKGYRHWHADIREDDTPLEAGVAFAIKLKSDLPFLGRAALEEQKQQGLRRKLVCLTTDKEHGPVLGHEIILRNGQVVGWVRRASFGHSLGRSIAYGYVSAPDGGVVDKAFLQDGAEYEIENAGKRFPATIHFGTLFDPKNAKIKS